VTGPQRRTTPAALVIRRARPADAPRLSALAHAAKRHWGYPARWMRLWRDDLTVSPAFIRRHPVYCARRGRALVGFYALSGAAPAFALEHMVPLDGGASPRIGTHRGHPWWRDDGRREENAMPVKLFDAASGTVLGTLSDEQFQFLADELEEESPEDADYYLDAVTVDMLEEDGAPEALIKLLRASLGDRDGMEIRWERS
jgi:hypothetical protein